MRSWLASNFGSHLTAKHCHTQPRRLPKLPQLSEVPQSQPPVIKLAAKNIIWHISISKNKLLSHMNHIKTRKCLIDFIFSIYFK